MTIKWESHGANTIRTPNGVCCWSPPAVGHTVRTPRWGALICTCTLYRSHTWAAFTFGLKLIEIVHHFPRPYKSCWIKRVFFFFFLGRQHDKHWPFLIHPSHNHRWAPHLAITRRTFCGMCAWSLPPVEPSFTHMFFHAKAFTFFWSLISYEDLLW